MQTSQEQFESNNLWKFPGANRVNYGELGNRELADAQMKGAK